MRQFLCVDVAIQPEVRFIAKQNSLMKIGNNVNLVFGPFDESTPLLDDRFDELPNQTENKSLTAVKSVAILEINVVRYRVMITNFFIPELNNHDVQELWFQQDGATCHTARATIDLLNDTFGDRLISRFEPVNWPPRSCDLTPLDYFLWGYVKSLVYADKPQTLDHLEYNIRRVIAEYGHKCWKKSSKTGRPDWTTSEPAVAFLCQKSYLKCKATRLSFE
ncbi:transposase [Trichonephila clavipes]|nr:transposase [Trichonephila clavipes]